MRTLLLFALAQAAALAASPAGYKLTWADEFNGANLDPAKWVYRTDSKHWSTQLASNVSIENGFLVLHLKKETAGDKQYTGAGIISKPAFGFGYYETRFRILAGKGWHSSFWMMGKGGTGTAATKLELDVIENDSINLYTYGVNLHRWEGEHTTYGHKSVEADTALSEFHVYGCEYTATEVKYFLDGKLVQTVDVAALPHGELNIWLTSIASHLGRTEAVDGTRLPGRVEYDYVRYYQRH